MLLESCLGSSEASHRWCELLSKQGAVLGKKNAVYAKSTILHVSCKLCSRRIVLARVKEVIGCKNC